MSLDSRIQRVREQARMRELFAEAQRPKFIRILSQSELEPKNSDVFKCCHGKHYFTPCVACKRTQAIADIYEQRFMSKCVE